MSKINWSTAPEGAELWADGDFFKWNGIFTYMWVDGRWKEFVDDFSARHSFEQRPNHIADTAKKVWPSESRIEQIGQNGGDGLHYDEQREAQEKMAAGEAHLKQSAEQNRAPNSLGKYDRRIKGKYNTGTCTVDVYRVLSAFEITEPELQHCIKKLLAAGQSGAKDYQQDLKEAAASLGMLIDRLQE